jgi:hypothetical protein
VSTCLKVRISAPARADYRDGCPDSFVAQNRDEDRRLLAALAANRPLAIGSLRRELAGEPAALAA